MLNPKKLLLIALIWFCKSTSLPKLILLTFVRGSGSVWVHLSTMFKVQVRFRFTEVKFCWFRFGLGSPKQNGSIEFMVRVQVWFDTLLKMLHLNSVVQVLTGHCILQRHKKTTGRAESSLCPKCCLEDETPNHHVGNCKLYQDIRVRYFGITKTLVHNVVTNCNINKLATCT